MKPDLMTLSEVADRLAYPADDPNRVRKLCRAISSHGTPYHRRGRNVMLTEGDYEALLEAMKCRGAGDTRAAPLNRIRERSGSAAKAATAKALRKLREQRAGGSSKHKKSFRGGR